MAAIVPIAGCGVVTEAAPVSTTLAIWNRSQTELLEVRVHDGDAYDAAPNLLETPLAVNDRIEVPFETSQRVTVIRRRVALDDPTAFTTDAPLDDVDGPGWVLIVFDRSFRLMEPGSSP